MLGDLSSRQLAEWMAYDDIKREEQIKATLAAKAGAGLRTLKATKRSGAP